MKTPAFETPNVNARISALRAYVANLEELRADLAFVTKSDVTLIVESFGRGAFDVDTLNALDEKFAGEWPWTQAGISLDLARALLAPMDQAEAA